MPSPFPGMDPYLEKPSLWPDVHVRLINAASEALGRQLRPRYYVRIEERVYISDPDDPGREEIAPDIHIAARRGEGGATHAYGGPALEVAEPVVITLPVDDDVRERHLEVIDRESGQVITMVEVLSPANKAAGARGRDSFVRKRREVMNSSCHWIEIDLLRKGKRMIAEEDHPSCEYLVLVSPSDRRPDGFVWPIRLSQRLPAIPIPLKLGEPGTTLDLQAVLDTAYDRAGYDLQFDYGVDPVPPLEGEWADWADRRLRDKGQRPGRS